VKDENKRLKEHVAELQRQVGARALCVNTQNDGDILSRPQSHLTFLTYKSA